MSQYIFNLIIYNWKSLINNKFEQETIQAILSLNYCTLIFFKKAMLKMLVMRIILSVNGRGLYINNWVNYLHHLKIHSRDKYLVNNVNFPHHYDSIF